MLLVCGSRDWPKPKQVRSAVRRWIRDTREAGHTPVIVSGAAKGPDTTAEALAERMGCPHLRVPAMWDELGKKAGIMRNIAQLSFAQALARRGRLEGLAFQLNDSRGTQDMIDRMESDGISVKKYSLYVRD